MDINLIASVALVIIAMLIVQMLVSWVRRKPHPNCPPCLPSLPLVGSLLFIPGSFKLLPEYFMKTAEKLGPIFAYYTGSRYTIVLNGREAYEAALVRNSTAFAGREQYYQEKYHANRNLKGLESKPFDKEFKFNHSLTLSILKDFGLGKENMESRVQVELEHFIHETKQNKGGSFDPRFLLETSLSNVILNVLLGRRFDYSDDRLERFARYPREYLGSLLFILDLVPMARFWPSCHKKIVDSENVTKAFLSLLEEEMRETFDRSSGNSLVEMYVGKVGPTYDHETLLFIVRDLLIGGSDLLATTIRWAMIMLANNPQVQESLQKEIDSVVPGDRLPSMDDKQNLPKIDAAYLEVMRWKTLVPLSDMRLTLSDTEVNGLFIPSGTKVVPNIWSVHMDPNVFPEPEKFKLERFLDQDGKVYGSDRIIPFSLGRRSCIGEILARHEIFIFFAGIIHHFNVLPPEGQTSIEVETMSDSLSVPKPFEIRLMSRK